ncbi:MAG: (2Fe-2S) ferredoxin domain-containing protein [Clostridiales Family XIII bacterium]|jgi:NADP-reducing hydrogenase subunit HndB|nr:(2Fe-2S) ferredoxin domain-containing protein [Clostridiales Family XIII bacterium]
MKSLEELKALRDKLQGEVSLRGDGDDKTKVLVGMATCGIAAGARPVLAEFVEQVAARGLKNVTVSQTGCIGICQFEPVVEVFVPGKEKVTYVNMSKEKVARIVADHIVGGSIVSEYTIGSCQS